MESEVDKLKALLGKLGVESANELEDLLTVDGWEQHMTPITACFKLAKQAAFRRCLGLS